VEKWKNPLTNVRSTTVGIVGLTVLWTSFQVFDKTPPPVLDQILVAVFGIWFATEAKRTARKKSAKDEEEDTDDE
jgi:hypothetical protein